jgi:hypothetical protein
VLRTDRRRRSNGLAEHNRSESGIEPEPCSEYPQRDRRDHARRHDRQTGGAEQRGAARRGAQERFLTLVTASDVHRPAARASDVELRATAQE